MIIFLICLLAIITGIFIFMRRPMFGAMPSGAPPEKIRLSKNYRNGSFQNLHSTPVLTEGVSYFTALNEFIFKQGKRRKPSFILPSAKTNLQLLTANQNVLVWFGHSSYFMQADGKKILVDPVFSGAASPLSFTTRSFAGSDVYTAAEMPVIDYLFIAHDHWDHLDFRTIVELKPKIKKIICGLGVGAHFKSWGFNAGIINELDWDEQLALNNGFETYAVAARHFSGRSFTRNKTLWLSFVLITPSFKLFIGGDSGYDTHFEKAGKMYGPFDLAILECGQYDKNWKYIHMHPTEVLKAANNLGAKRLLPVHWGKFALANHDWDTPIKTLTALNNVEKILLLTPRIGEAVNLDDRKEVFSKWWN